MHAEAPLDGIVVVELGHSVAAPYAGMILADLGARVIKVENPSGGDYARDWGPPFWKDTASAFAALKGRAMAASSVACQLFICCLRSLPIPRPWSRSRRAWGPPVCIEYRTSFGT